MGTMKVIFVLYCVFLSGIKSQGIAPFRQQVPQIQRRQLTQIQQNHILTDIQKHQHRFNVQQPQLRNQFNGFVQQPSQSFAFPPQTIPNGRFLPQQPLPNQQLPSPQQPQLFRQPSVQVAPQNLKQSQFQRSVHSQVGQVSFNQPPPQFLAPQPAPVFQDINGFGPIASPLVQQPPIRQQQNFFPNGNVQFPQQQPVQQPPIFSNFQPQVQNPFLQQTQSLPLEQRSNVFLDTRTEEQKRREEVERQKLIEKHERFAQKYYQNQQQQVQRQHQEFLQQQKQIQEQTAEKLRTQQSQVVQTQQNYVRQQNVKPTDLTAFEKSVQQYYQQHPTTTTSTTTQAPTTTTTANSLNVVPLKKSKVKQEIKVLNADDIKQLLQGDRQSSLLSQLKLDAVKGSKSSKVKSPLSRDELLKQLKQQLAEETPDLGGNSFSSQDIVLPNGEKVQVIRTTDPELIKKAQSGQLVEPIATASTQAPLSIEDLAKSGFLPAGGTDIEVIKQSESGLQKVQKVPSQKKVTFVYLEEQDDGSYKVQGVKSNNDKDVKTSGTEVDTILKRIKNGDIQLPAAAAKKVELPIEVPTPKTTLATTQRQSQSTPISTRLPVSSTSSLPKNHRATNSNNVITTPAKSSTIKFSSSTAAPQTITPARQPSSSRGSFHYSFSSATTANDNGRSPYSTLPTFETTQRNNVFSVTPRVQRVSTTEAPDYATASSINYIRNAEAQKLVQTVSASTVAPIRSSISYSPTFTTTPPTTTTTHATTTTKSPDLTEILKASGLFAMAKYLHQSGLDSILNETGPYTIFAPTDKAFKSLLVQLGGPEKAEEKFRNNPRLLSGLLLHHVIPGAFKIEELQDEMTGVSLAGTQLRVNQYQMQDVEWNDIKVTTINGATVTPDNTDVVIPQGVAHAIDRVMFPLPVGDILQTLQSDRERRFTNFLRAVFASNMADTLQNKGIKTYTIFAPTDFAFSHLTQDELNTMISDKDSAQQLVNRHIVPGTLFTSGMRFYQVKDTLAEDKAITVQKNGGKVKVNDSTILTSNIPATNGVIHAIDTLL